MAKKHAILKITLLTSIILLSGCDQKIDASNESSIINSVSQISKKTETDKALQFQSALKSVFNYAYAKTHDGEIYSDQEFSFTLVTSKLENRPSDKEKQKSIDADKIIISIIKDKSLEDIINLKPELDKSIAKMQQIRNLKIKEDDDKAQFLTTEKIKLTNELINKEQDKKKMIKIDEATKVLEAEIQDTAILLEKNIKEEEIIRKKIEPYEMADNAYNRVHYKNVQISSENNNKVIKFNLVNDSNLPILSVDFSYIISIEGQNDYTLQTKQKFQSPLKSGESIVINVERSEHFLNDVSDLSAVTFSLRFNSFDTIIDNKPYIISIPSGKKSGPESYHVALSKTLSTGVQLKNKLDFLNNQLNNIRKEY